MVRYVPSFIYMKGCKENVDTNVTVTKNIRKCYFALTCSNRNPGGLWEQQWNSHRFLLKFHFFKLDNNSAFRIQRSVWTGLRGSIRHGQQCVHVGLHIDDIRGSDYERFFTVLRHIIWQERQEMRQNCGYPLHELHFAVHRKDGSIGATIGKRDGRSSRSWSSQGTRADTHAMQEVECFCQHSSLLLGLD